MTRFNDINNIQNIKETLRLNYQHDKIIFFNVSVVEIMGDIKVF